MATRARSGRNRRRARRPRPTRGSAPRRQRSDLAARILAAIPAVALALFLVIEGGTVFALGVLLFGGICLHELFAMFDRAHPVRLAGFIGLTGLIAAAHYGGQYQILLVAVSVL